MDKETKKKKFELYADAAHAEYAPISRIVTILEIEIVQGPTVAPKTKRQVDADAAHTECAPH